MSETPRNRQEGVGDARTFEGIYRDHKDAVYAYARSLTPGSGHAEDLVHDAFIGLLRNPRSMTSALSIRAYLLRSVRNRFVDRARSGDSRLARLEDARMQSAATASRDGSLEARDDASAIRKAVATLPAAQSDVLRLRIHGRLDFASIGAILGIPAATARTRYRAALGKLKTILEGTFLDG